MKLEINFKQTRATSAGDINSPILVVNIGILKWSGGAMVLGKLSVPGRPTDLDQRRTRAYCACSKCELCGHFICLSSTDDIDRNTISKSPNQKQTANGIDINFAFSRFMTKF